MNKAWKPPKGKPADDAAEEARPLTPEEDQAILDELDELHTATRAENGLMKQQIREALSYAISEAMRDNVPEYTPDQMTRRVAKMLTDEKGVEIPEPFLDSDLYVHMKQEIAVDLFRRTAIGELRDVGADPTVGEFRFSHLGTEIVVSNLPKTLC